MFAENITEFVMFKMIFIQPNEVNEFPLVKHFITDQEPPAQSEPFLQWYSYVKSKEYLHVPRGNTIRFAMWRINSGDIDLFMVRNIRYDTLFFFVGEETIYWIFYTPGDISWIAQGTTPLTINYCSCCFDKQYLQFIACIKKSTERNYTSRITIS